MDTQRTFFDTAHKADLQAKRDGAVKRDAAVKQVATNNPEWKERFEAAILSTARKRVGEWFTSDDVLQDFPELEACSEKRVIGAAFKALSGKRLIVAGGYTDSNRSQSHARPKRQWRLNA